jgi:poly(3-hydroxybutyrate) depolymerase
MRFLPGCCVLLVMASFSYGQLDSFETGGAMRSFLIHAPAGLTQPALLMSMHGATGDGAFQQSRTQFNTIADREKFIVVYPNGNYTNASHSWDLSGDEDVTFLCALIDTMIARYSVDRTRVYCNGFSLGGMMTYHLACCAAHRLAAVVSVSGPVRDFSCQPAYPLPVMHIHGLADNTIDYSNARTTVDKWITQLGCPLSPEVTDHYPAGQTASKVKKEYWGPCSQGSEVILLSVEGLDHTWPNTTNSGFNASEEIWNFLKSHTPPDGISAARNHHTVRAGPGIDGILRGTVDGIREISVFNAKGAVVARWEKGMNPALIGYFLNTARTLHVIRLKTDRGGYIFPRITLKKTR